MIVTSTAKAGAASGATVPGGRADLFETVATVTATITLSPELVCIRRWVRVLGK